MWNGGINGKEIKCFIADTEIKNLKSPRNLEIFNIQLLFFFNSTSRKASFMIFL